MKFFALLIAGAVAAAAWLQAWAARNKLRLDLFDRRYKVFDATREFILYVVSHADVDDTHFDYMHFDYTHIFEWNTATSDAEFLFDADVVRLLDEIRKQALTIRTSRMRLRRSPVGEERNHQAQILHDAIKWLATKLSPREPCLSLTLNSRTYGQEVA